MFPASPLGMLNQMAGFCALALLKDSVVRGIDLVALIGLAILVRYETSSDDRVSGIDGKIVNLHSGSMGNTLKRGKSPIWGSKHKTANMTPHQGWPRCEKPTLRLLRTLNNLERSRICIFSLVVYMHITTGPANYARYGLQMS